MSGTRPPRLVAIGAVLLGLLGIVTIGLGILSSGPGWLAGGVGLIAVGIWFWRGSRPAAWAGGIVGLAALLPGLYGLMGSFVVAEQIAMCGKVASLASYPAGFCESVNWVTQIGTGVLLIGIGVAGLVVIAAAMRHSAYFTNGRVGAV